MKSGRISKAKNIKSKKTKKVVKKGIFSRFSPKLALLLIASIGVMGYVATKPSEAVTAKTALIYGDSVTQESRFMIAEFSATKSGWTHVTRSWGGTAPCDWLTWLPNDLAIYQPSIVAISTMGNNLTDCMKDASGIPLQVGSQDYYNRYRSDLSSFMSQVTATGSKLVFMKAPPAQDAARNTAITQLNSIATELAGQYHGVSISSTARNAVSSSGKYIQYKKCLTTETVTQGCGSDGKIAIRSWDGLHLCPITLAAYSTCNVYSSGEVRWAKAAVNATVNPPAPVLP
jgi:hypothetical protein